MAKLGPFTFDGFGINDCADPYRERIATLTGAYKDKPQYGELLAAAPELLGALKSLLDSMEAPRTQKATNAWDFARTLVAKMEVSNG